MSFARDKLYKGYLLKNMSTIVSTVKTREIVPHLSCLTDHDRVSLKNSTERHLITTLHLFHTIRIT